MKAAVTGCWLLFSTLSSACAAALFVPRHYSFPLAHETTIELTVFEQVVQEEQEDALHDAKKNKTNRNNKNNNKNNKNKIEENQLGFQTWRGGELLANYLLHQGKEKMRGSTVLELGCGVGLPGFMSAKLGARTVVFTDMTDQLLESARLGARASGVFDVNIDIDIDDDDNNKCCRFLTLNWKDVIKQQQQKKSSHDNHNHNHNHIKERLLGTGPGGFDYILAADCVYSVETAKLLAQTAAALADPGRTQFIALTGSRSDRAGVEIFQKELSRTTTAGGSLNINIEAYDGNGFEFRDPNGNQLPLCNGGDLYGNLLWHVTWGTK